MLARRCSPGLGARHDAALDDLIAELRRDFPAPARPGVGEVPSDPLVDRRPLRQRIGCMPGGVHRSLTAVFEIASRSLPCSAAAGMSAWPISPGRPAPRQPPCRRLPPATPDFAS